MVQETRDPTTYDPARDLRIAKTLRERSDPVFNRGDLVRLIPTGPLMKVIGVDPKGITVVWLDSRLHLEKQTLGADLLIKVEIV